MSREKVQYFTDSTVVSVALRRLRRHRFATAIDPAMGEGVFLAEARRLWPRVKLYGIDLDRKLVERMSARIGRVGVFISGDSLLQRTLHRNGIREVLEKGGFDLVVGNPPFSRWRIQDQALLARFQIAAPPRGGRYRSQPCEVLFIEQFLRLCRGGGYIVIVLPNGLLCNPRDIGVRKYIVEHAQVEEVVSVPSGIFAGTDARTAVLILRKRTDRHPEAKDGRVILHSLYRRGDRVGLDGHVSVELSSILERMDYGFHDPSLVAALQGCRRRVTTKRLGDLVKYIAAGHTLYGRRRRFSRKGGLRYISSKTISPCGIDYCRELRFVRPGSPMDRASARVKRGDILFVRVGEGCLGRVVVARRMRSVGIANDCIWIIRRKNISPYYIALVLQTRYGKLLIERGTQCSTGASSISKRSFLSCEIPILGGALARPFIEAYKRKVLDLHLEAVDRGIRGDQDGYSRGVVRAEANLLEIVKGLEKLLAGSGNGRDESKGNGGRGCDGKAGRSGRGRQSEVSLSRRG